MEGEREPVFGATVASITCHRRRATRMLLLRSRTSPAQATKMQQCSRFYVVRKSERKKQTTW